jgi:hypothetical protein
VPDSTTPNKGFDLPTTGEYVNSWGPVVNQNFTEIDTALAGTTTISVTGVTAGTYTLTLTQYTPPNIEFTGVLTALLNYQFPAGIGGVWTISNATSGAFALTVSIASGNSLVLVAGRSIIVSDGATLSLADGGNITAAANAAQTAAIAAAEAFTAAGYAPLTTGTFTPSWIGFSSPPALTSLSYSISGKMACVNIQLAGFGSGVGTSNNAAFAIGGLPGALSPSSARAVAIVGLENNGNFITGGAATINSGGTQINLYPDGSIQNTWTGAKGFGQNTSIIYPL